MRRRNQVSGCIFINHGRYWWRVTLPGEKKLKAHPLIPHGGALATDEDKRVIKCSDNAISPFGKLRIAIQEGEAKASFFDLNLACKISSEPD